MGQLPERRNGQRIKKHFIVTYYDVADPHVKFDASQLKNISLGGVCLVTPKPFPPATQLLIEFKTPFESDLTQIHGTVLESHEKIKGIIYETRLKFHELSPDANRILTKIIHHFDKEEDSQDE